MLGRRVCVLHLLRFALRSVEYFNKVARRISRRGALHLRQSPQRSLREIAGAHRINPCLQQESRGRRGLFGEHRREQVQGRNLRVSSGRSSRLRGGNRLLSERGELFESHGVVRFSSVPWTCRARTEAGGHRESKSWASGRAIEPRLSDAEAVGDPPFAAVWAGLRETGLEFNLAAARRCHRQRSNL